MPLAAELDEALPERLAVGAGSCLFLVGRCRHPGKRIGRLWATLDGARAETTAHGIEGDRFWGFLPLPATERARPARLGLVAELSDGAGAEAPLGTIELLPRWPPIEAGARAEPGEAPLVAICMATYEPPPQLLERQLESLRRQTHRRWVCLISDDCSSEAAVERIAGLIEGDARFFLSRSPRRLGHYRNFERALTMVPAGAAFVALCDQDDSWHPQKLAALIAAIGDAELAYSDMRVLDERGRVVSETFWNYKRNNYTNLASLLLDNTVTGAASLFRPSLLAAATPFPPPLEWSHHDHWLASVALATGRIAYLDRPLYDYVQHGSAATPLHPAARHQEPALERPEPLPGRLGRHLAEGRLAYFKDLCRVALSARVLESRCAARITPRKLRAVRRVAGLGEPPEPAAWLALRALRPLLGRDETLRFERSLLKAVAWRRSAARRA